MGSSVKVFVLINGQSPIEKQCYRFAMLFTEWLPFRKIASVFYFIQTMNWIILRRAHDDPHDNKVSGKKKYYEYYERFLSSKRCLINETKTRSHKLIDIITFDLARYAHYFFITALTAHWRKTKFALISLINRRKWEVLKTANFLLFFVVAFQFVVVSQQRHFVSTHFKTKAHEHEPFKAIYYTNKFIRGKSHFMSVEWVRSPYKIVCLIIDSSRGLLNTGWFHS